MTMGELGKYKRTIKKLNDESKELLLLHWDNLTEAQRVKVRTQLTIRQDGCCAICGQSEKELKREICIDHCHITGHIRGLLCGRCNSLLGFAKDNVYILEAAAAYLRENH